MVQSETFVTQRPESPLLREYIAYYYFHECTDSTVKKQFIYYPGYKNALTIYKNARVEFGENYSSVSPDQNSDFIFIYSGVQKHLRRAYIAAPFQKIGVVFKELGINHFVSCPLSLASPDPIDKSFDYFGEELKNHCRQIYSLTSRDEKVKLLDHFFQSRFQNLAEPVLKSCVKLIMAADQKLTITCLSDQLSINRKTLLRLFNKHLGCSAKDYVDIVQFRKSLNAYLLEQKQDSLTGIALENDYYDQSQFINHFKKLTGTNPKAFFKDIRHIGREDTFWTFQ